MAGGESGEGERDWREGPPPRAESAFLSSRGPDWARPLVWPLPRCCRPRFLPGLTDSRNVGRNSFSVAGVGGCWPFRGFPATQRETRGSPALCVSGSFQGNQRVFGAPFCFSRVSLGKLASFPESESWSGAKSGAKLRKSARYPGIFQVYRGFPGIPAKYPVFCRFWPQNSLRHGSEPPQNDEFHGVSPGFPEETRGCCRETSRKHGKETR